MSNPRRSSRANKGQNKKLEEEQKEAEELYQRSIQESLLPPKPKRAISKASKGSKVAPEEDDKSQESEDEDDEVRCLVCGITEDDHEAMVQCDKCHSWEHNNCVLKDPEDVPETYLCYYCNPSDPYLKTLNYKLDADDYYAEKKAEKKRIHLKQRKDDNDDDEFQSVANEDEREDNKLSDNGEEEDNVEYSTPNSNNTKKRSRSSTSVTKSKSRSRSKSESVTRQSPPVRVDTKKFDQNLLELNKRASVSSKFEEIFLSLLPGHTIPSETDSVQEISSKWSKKLEQELHDAYSDPVTGKSSPSYNEGFRRIYTNVKDAKNEKLRASIINKTIPFSQLVRLSVKDLLNPELRKEKEEAIRESMNQATLEVEAGPKMRKTKKGDEMIENDEPSNLQQYDLNVGGLGLDNDEKKFISSETNVNYERKNSLYTSNNDHLDDEEADFQEAGYDEDEDHENQPREGTPVILQEEDEDLNNILSDSNKEKLEEQAEFEKRKREIEEDEKLRSQEAVWEGQFVFTGVTNFYAELKLIATTLANSEFNTIAPHMLEFGTALTVQGRLDTKKADAYIAKAAAVRRLVLLELKSHDNPKNFKRLFDYFHSKDKYGVLLHPDKPFIKDAYLVPISDETPLFLEGLHRKDIPGTKCDRLFLIYIIKPEMIKTLGPRIDQSGEYDPTEPASNSESVDSVDLATSLFPTLNPDELALVRRIFDEHPDTKQDTNLLIQYLQEALIPSA